MSWVNKTLIVLGLILSACQYLHKKPSADLGAKNSPSISSKSKSAFISGLVIKNSRFEEGVSPTPFFSLKFINEQVFTKQDFQNMPVGGLSALAYDPKGQVFLALSDDKGNKGFPPRFYKFQLFNKGGVYSLKMSGQVRLSDSKGQAWTPIDPEGIAILDEERILISSEGAQLPSLSAPPQVFVFNLNGVWKHSFPVLDMYWRAHQIGKWGVKENKAFEALSLDPKKRYMYLATESALHQDSALQGQECSWSSELGDSFRQFIRITRWNIKNKAWVSGRGKAHTGSGRVLYQQYIYPMETCMTQNNMKGMNGLTDFVALGEKKLLTLERAYLKKRGLKNKKMSANVVRMFLTDCSKASDVSQYEKLSPMLKPSSHHLNHTMEEQKMITCGKTLITHLNQISTRPFASQKQGRKKNRIKVDNIEGIALGPEVSKGKYLLVLVSDNNFSKSQKTQFLFFHYLLRPSPL